MFANVFLFIVFVKKRKIKSILKAPKKHFIKKEKEKKKMYSILNYVYTVNLNKHF